MTQPTPEILEARKWCVETAFKHCEDAGKATALAAELILLIETGRPPVVPGPAVAGPAEGTLDLSRILVGTPEPDYVPDPGEIQIFSGAAPQSADDPPTPIGEPPAPARRSIPRMPAPTPPDGPDLPDKEQAVLAAIILLAAGGDWPAVAAISDASDVPRGSVHAVLERLLRKGYLARPDGKWTLVDKTRARAAE